MRLLLFLLGMIGILFSAMVLVRNAEQTVCSHCKGREAELYCKTVANGNFYLSFSVAELEKLFGRCGRSARNAKALFIKMSFVQVWTVQYFIFYRRKKAQKDMAETKVQLDRWQF
ncbi:hypothetical protein Sjap_018007 [Stephania japonica]|uniref:Secreted protein n=1 Tax=Stephania japonica TaxID=461633 RepID=A0AAP0I794_9MAGN